MDEPIIESVNINRELTMFKNILSGIAVPGKTTAEIRLNIEKEVFEERDFEDFMRIVYKWPKVRELDSKTYRKLVEFAKLIVVKAIKLRLSQKERWFVEELRAFIDTLE